MRLRNEIKKRLKILERERVDLKIEIEKMNVIDNSYLDYCINYINCIKCVIE